MGRHSEAVKAQPHYRAKQAANGRNNRALTPAQEQALVQGYLAGEKVSALMRCFSIGKSTVRDIRKRAGVPARQPWCPRRTSQ